MNADGIERRVMREAVATLQYPHCYSTAGTVHGAAARVGARGTPAAGLRPRPARGKGFPSNLLLP